MEIRDLKYFVTVANEQNFSKAAEKLFITQPNLSRQIKKLEEEIGQTLFLRGKRQLTLTESGILLKKRAEEILELYEKTENDMKTNSNNINGEIYIGCAESNIMLIVAKVAKRIKDENYNIKFHLYSGDSEVVSDKLNKGLIDFGIFVEPFDLSKYEYLTFPSKNEWGVLMLKNSELSKKECINHIDLQNKPLIISKQSFQKSDILKRLNKDINSLNIVATYNLMFNASFFVEEGLGYLIGLENILNVSNNDKLVFKTLEPKVFSKFDIAWKKYYVFSPSSLLFLKYLKEEFEILNNSDK